MIMQKSLRTDGHPSLSIGVLVSAIWAWSSPWCLILLSFNTSIDSLWQPFCIEAGRAIKIALNDAKQWSGNAGFYVKKEQKTRAYLKSHRCAWTSV